MLILYKLFPGTVQAFLQKLLIPAYLGDTAGSVPDHHNKANIAIKRVTQIFGFPVHIKFMFILLL